MNTEQIIKWITENAFNVEAQDGTKHIVVDAEQLRNIISNFNCVNFADGEERCEKQCKYCERVKGF
jgi:hypothetical protein